MDQGATVLITGGTGMIGRALTKSLLERGYNIIILTRQQKGQDASTSRISYATWDIKNQTIDKEAVSKADYIIHLAGAGIADKRWTKKRKKEIVESRVKSGELLVKALNENANTVKAVISSSAIGYYGPSPFNQLMPGKQISQIHMFEETDPPAADFLAQTCLLWEQSLEPVTKMGKRLVRLRTGIVLSGEGGALTEFIKPLRYGIATILGSGKQTISWIHIEDLARIYVTAIENQDMAGTYNAVAPMPVSNKELVLQLAKFKRGTFFIPIYVPAFILKLILGEMSIEVLKGASVSCNKIHFAGFTFLYPSLKAALEELTN